MRQPRCANERTADFFWLPFARAAQFDPPALPSLPFLPLSPYFFSLPSNPLPSPVESMIPCHTRRPETAPVSCFSPPAA